MMLFPQGKSNTVDLDAVLQTLSQLRVTFTTNEYELQGKIQAVFDENGIPYIKEYRIAPRNRLDFFVDGGIVVEVKRGKNKPNRSKVVEQLSKYAAFPEVRALILVVDRNVQLPQVVNGKPCVAFGLNKLWGIAL